MICKNESEMIFMKIAVLSDTHGLLRPQVLSIIGECDAVFHAGDVDSPDILERIREGRKAGAPLYVVRGNNDGKWAEDLPESVSVSFGGVRFYMAHDKADIPEELGDRQIVIYGHSHRYSEESRDGRVWLNPGSCGKRRFFQKLTMAVLEQEEDSKEACFGWRIRRIDIAEEAAQEPGIHGALPDENLTETIEAIMKRMKRGQHVTKISRDLGLDQEFVEQMCRLSVTHPGVSAQGLRDKIEANKTITKSSRKNGQQEDNGK